jgi:(E)-4-hydroxy-3-methylbut-2-enyl-diphosphate synthase
MRRVSRIIKVGNLTIGGESPISVQSMTNTDTMDKPATLAQVKALRDAGCDIVRITVPDAEAAKTISYIKESGIDMPLVADIHFDYKAALAAISAGADKIRINPGNIGSDDRIKAVCDACRKNNIPIRVGVNGGSLEKSLLEKYGAPTAEALAESALLAAKTLERFDFNNIVLSIKSSNVSVMIEANKRLAELCDYPLHIGVTEAGSATSGSIKNAVGIGSLLSQGIGDTIRVSLTADPVLEVKAGIEILSALGLNPKPRLNIISCPTCGRTQINLIELSRKFEEAVKAEGLENLPATVALMGCAVNGPGEAREADIGAAGGKGEALLFKKGTAIRKIPEGEIVEMLIGELKGMNE